MWKRLKAWWRAERATEALMLLDDRLLADMGLDRTGLRQRMRGAEERELHQDESGPDLCLQEVQRC